MGERLKLASMKDNDHETVRALKSILGDLFDRQLSVIKDTLNETKNEVSTIREKMKVHEAKLEHNGRYTRLNNIIVHGVPYIKGEKPLQVAVDLKRALGLEIYPSDLDTAHCLRTRKENADAPPPFILRSVNRWRRDELMLTIEEKRPKADILGGDPGRSIFCHEQLSPWCQEIWNEAQNHKEYFYLWSFKGDVHA